MATRVFELARELGVTSKVILEKCRAEGLEIKNHMTTLSAGQEATVREWFGEQGAATAVETAEHVDLAGAREQAKKVRRKRGQAAAAEAAAAAPVAVLEAAAPAAVVEAPPEAAVAVEVEPAVAAPPPAAEEGKVSAPAVAAAEAPPAVEAVAAPVAGPQEPVAFVPAVPEAPPKPPEKPQPPVIRPAGPQLVPKPAQVRGPRVVRVERPDFVPLRPPPRPLRPADGVRSGPVPVRRPVGTPVAPEEETGDRKKTKRRSPRRRGGRSADSGEKLHEWGQQDLAERSERLAAAGGGLRRHRATVARKPLEAGPKLRPDKIPVSEPITVKSLSAATGIKSTRIIRKLMELGMASTVNQVIGRDLAESVALENGMELEIQAARTAEGDLAIQLESRRPGARAPRAPVVTFLGHVDHGKTSLLDRIRQTSVAAGEAGGITQHIGAYRFDAEDRHVVFLDTPGHQAFTAMRARGANMTDVVVLVVAADDGVMPQTIEAISHARAANVPIVVALNKIDMPAANIQRVLGQLAEQGLQPREWGGNTEVIKTSATTGEGIDDLVETLSLEAELLELQAEPDAPAGGFVIEAEMDSGQGVLARLLVRDGTLHVGDVLLAGAGFGRVRRITDSHGKSIREAGPATPVEVAGLDEMPEAGDRFQVVQDVEAARLVAEERRQKARAKELAPLPGRSLQDLLQRIEAGQAGELPIILKADVQGSVEAILGQLEKLGTEEVRVKVLHAAAGGISTGDVALAEASNAIILGFDVVPDAAARQLAEEQGVDIRMYRIIYELIEDVRKALEQGLEPEVRQQTLGRAEVRQIFKISKLGTVAGCMVSDGLAARNARVRIIRDNVVIGDGRTIESLRRFKDDAREVRAGMECGVKIAGYDDLKQGDVLEFYQQVEVARQL